MNTMTTRCALGGCLAAVLSLTARGAETDAPREACLKVVRAYADAMLHDGRDAYGKVHSPLFAAALNRRTLKVFEKSPPGLPDIRNSDRTYNGANPMLDMNLLQTLYALSETTGDARYAAEADAAIRWFFEHCQSPKGLMAWGEHQGWDFLTDGPSAPKGAHELYRPWVFWERSFALAPEACQRFAVGLWKHQIGDPKKGLFSRHAMDIWDEDKVSARKGYEFPRHGGFYIATWAAAYRRNKDPLMLEAIASLLDGFLSRRHPASGAIPAQTSLPELMWPHSNLSLAVDLWDAAAAVPAPLADKIRVAARHIDEVFLKTRHEPGPGGKGFVKSCHTSTLEPGDVRADEAGGTKGLRWRPYTEVWATGYGVAVHASPAMLCGLRYAQIHDPRYKRLLLDTADAYLSTVPPFETGENAAAGGKAPVTYPGAVGEVILLETAAYRLSGEKKYLERADHFAQLAMATFFPTDSPLPRVASGAKYSWYEAITRADTLAMALLDLRDAHLDRAKPSRFIWSDR